MKRITKILIDNNNQSNQENMEKRERAVCGTLCLCLAVAVMSAVALVYLTVIIYMPTQRELTSGINEVPVMCTTTERKQIKAKCLIERECIRCVG